MYKVLSRFFNSHLFLILGVVIGLYLSTFLGAQVGPLCDSLEVGAAPRSINVQPSLRPPLGKPNKAKKKLVRPRYYSTELGIREKLFVGVFTSEEKVNQQAIHINKTLGHLVNRIKFFITAQYKLTSKFNLSGLVGFSDTRPRYRPFQVLKYIGDNFGQDYDYYFLATDYTFVNGHRLNELVGRISVSMDVYMGAPVPDGSFCNLDAGIILSNSVIKSVREHLDWCILNAVSDDPSENMGRCIHHSIGLTCQLEVQGRSLETFKLKHFEVGPHLPLLSHQHAFNGAVTLYPVLQSDGFHILNAYFLRQRLGDVKKAIDELTATDLGGVWPPGQKAGAKPLTRFDLIHQYYFNMSHVFQPDDFTNVRKHTRAELDDINNVLDEVKISAAHDQHYEFRRLVNGYRKFDLSRGLDYVLDLGFRDLATGKETVRRFEVCKPLGKVEFVPVPYVTENSRISIVLPVEEHQVGSAMWFLQGYARNIMERKEKTFLMLALLYQADSVSQGVGDVFEELKSFATKTTQKFKKEDVKVAWVSVKLPKAEKVVYVEEHQVLNFAVVDLALKKIGLESLVLVLDVYANVTGDFLNRVRMNTIPRFQVFSAIPFRQYNPKITQVRTLDIGKNSGHFDREEYKYVAFYSSDYVEARKKFHKMVPIIRVDNDIEGIIGGAVKDVGNIFEMFVKYGGEIHAMRATEMGLKVKSHETKRRWNGFLGTKAQLSAYLITKQAVIPELRQG